MMVRATGLEPACLTTYEPKSYVSANSTTPAYATGISYHAPGRLSIKFALDIKAVSK